MKRPVIFLFALALSLLMGASSYQQVSAADVEVTVRITHVTDIGDDADDLDSGDFFAVVTIGGQAAQASSQVEDDDFDTNWTFTRTVVQGSNIPITISLVDFDSFATGEDDIADISPQNQDVSLELTYNAITGTWSGEGGLVTGGYAQGDGDPNFPDTNDGYDASIRFEIFNGTDRDTDDDGIADSVENNGIRKADGTLVRDINTDPCRKTVIVRIDYMLDAGANAHSHEPKDAAITLVVNAFANSGVAATNPCPYGATPASGIEFVYIKGNQLAEDAERTLDDAEWNAARDASLTPEERDYIHYVEFAHDLPGLAGTSGLCCSGKDLIATLGSWNIGCVGPGANKVLDTPLGSDDTTTPDGLVILVGNNRNCDSAAVGDDMQALAVGTGSDNAQVGTAIEQAGTIMHEFGHALGLPHGGFENTNNKPNYFSVMNYSYQTNMFSGAVIPATGLGTRIVDYSKTVLPDLDKSQLDESQGAQANANFWIAWNDNTGTAHYLRPNATGGLDWDWDTVITASPPAAKKSVNLNFDTICIHGGADNTIQTAIVPDDQPDSTVNIVWGDDKVCDTVTPTNDDTGVQNILKGFDDWNAIKYAGKDGVNAGGIGAAEHTSPDLDYRTSLNQTFAAILSQDPVVEIKKEVKPANAPGLFNLQVDDVTVGTGANAPHGGTTGEVTIERGSRKIGESAGTNTVLSRYETKISCVYRATGGLYAEGDGISLTLNLTGGENLICTITNRLPIPDECLAQTYNNFIFGDPGNNTLVGTRNTDVIIGYAGIDKIEGGQANDCIAGGDDNDTLSGGIGNDIMVGDKGNDTINGGNDNDTIFGGADNDTINSGNGNDLVYGNAGTDTINGSTGIDRCNQENGGPPTGLTGCEQAAPLLP